MFTLISDITISLAFGGVVYNALSTASGSGERNLQPMSGCGESNLGLKIVNGSGESKIEFFVHYDLEREDL